MLLLSLLFLSNELTQLGIKIEKRTAGLLQCLSNFLNISRFNIIQKWRTVTKSKVEMSLIINQLSKYKSLENLLKQLCDKHVQKVLQDETTSSKFLKLISWGDFTTPSSNLDISSVFRSIEHVRREIETFSLNTSTIVSALLGGLSGSVITLLLTGLG